MLLPGLTYQIAAPLANLIPASWPRVSVGNSRFAVAGRLAQGDGCDVFLARRDSNLTEMVVLKILRAPQDRDLLQREWKLLGEIREAAEKAASSVARLLPQRVTHGTARCAGKPDRLASVFRWRSGFQLSLAQLPSGLDARAAVWMWNRMLAQLDRLHGLGFVHGAVLPPHCLIHPRDHGLVMCGWSAAARSVKAAPRLATSAQWNALVPPGPPTAAGDVAMSARCIAHLLAKSQVPSGLLELIQRVSAPERASTAGQVLEQLREASSAAFGPPSFHRLALPGW
jgi:hypothetical protein